jgi:hypothetical protein
LAIIVTNSGWYSRKTLRALDDSRCFTDPVSTLPNLFFFLLAGRADSLAWLGGKKSGVKKHQCFKYYFLNFLFCLHLSQLIISKDAKFKIGRSKIQNSKWVNWLFALDLNAGVDKSNTAVESVGNLINCYQT